VVVGIVIAEVEVIGVIESFEIVLAFDVVGLKEPLPEQPV